MWQQYKNLCVPIWYQSFSFSLTRTILSPLHCMPCKVLVSSYEKLQVLFTWETSLTFEKLHDMLVTYESYIRRLNYSIAALVATVNYSAKKKGYNSIGQILTQPRLQSRNTIYIQRVPVSRVKNKIAVTSPNATCVTKNVVLQSNVQDCGQNYEM